MPPILLKGTSHVALREAAYTRRAHHRQHFHQDMLGNVLLKDHDVIVQGGWGEYLGGEDGRPLVDGP